MMDERNKGKIETSLPLRKRLLELTKSLLYRLAQSLKIPGRSKMTKSELVESLNRRKKKVEPMLATLTKPNAKVEARESRVKEALKAVAETTSRLPEVMVEKMVSSQTVTPVLEKPAEPVEVWHGEEGPELPREYGRTLLRAMPRDPYWVYLYWEISEETRRQLIKEGGEWIFEVSTPLLRIVNQDGVLQEIPILLDALSWYLSLPSSRDYEFEIGLKAGETFYLIARSNKVSLPPSQPSSVTDEEWAILESRFEEMLEAAATGGLQPFGGSGVQPHLFRQRIRMPWNITMLHHLPTSQFQSISSSVWPSSTTFGKKR